MQSNSSITQLYLRCMYCLSPPSIPTHPHTHTPGQQYNKDGILEQWWTNYSTANFRERQQCFVDQYSQYELFGYHVSLNTVCES